MEKKLIGTKMTECLAEGATQAREWLKQAARHGVMPISKRLEEHGVIT